MRMTLITIVLSIMTSMGCALDTNTTGDDIENVGDDSSQMIGIGKIDFVDPKLFTCIDLSVRCSPTNDDLIQFCYKNRWYPFGFPCIDCEQIGPRTFRCKNSPFINDD